MKTNFVTGGAGFIGSALVRLLHNGGDVRIVNIDKLTYAGNLSSLPNIDEGPLYRFAQFDICDAAALHALFEAEQPDGVFHLAAESHVDRSIEAAGEFINTNIVGTMNVLEAARHYYGGLTGAKAQAFRVLHVSTDEVYGTLGDTDLFEETTAYDPRSPYSASKAGSDFLASAWFHTYGLPVVISNCSNNYGPFHFPEKLIPLMILNARKGHPLPVYGDGLNIRDWLYVDDHARALRLILEQGRLGEKYNVGGRNERTNLEVVHALCDHLDTVEPLANGQSRSTLITFVPDRPGHDRRYAIDATKLENELNWKAQENFETGIAKTIDWYLNNEWWWQPLQHAAKERRGAKA